MRAVAAAACALFLCGCPGPGGPAKDTFQWRADIAPAAYFPLAEGNAWSYDVADLVTGEKILLVNRVDKREGNRSEMVSGAEPLFYEYRGDAILRFPSGATVLRTPVQPESGWEIPNGRAKITAIDAVVETAGQKYASCVVVEETTDDRRVVTWFAPGVGPVKVEVYARGPAGERLERRGLMRSFHPASAPPL